MPGIRAAETVLSGHLAAMQSGRMANSGHRLSPTCSARISAPGGRVRRDGPMESAMLAHIASPQAPPQRAFDRPTSSRRPPTRPRRRRAGTVSASSVRLAPSHTRAPAGELETSVDSTARAFAHARARGDPGRRPDPGPHHVRARARPGRSELRLEGLLEPGSRTCAPGAIPLRESRPATDSLRARARPGAIALRSSSLALATPRNARCPLRGVPSTNVPCEEDARNKPHGIREVGLGVPGTGARAPRTCRTLERTGTAALA